jgi:hypothetical protein
MDSRLSQQIATIRTAEALEQSAIARAGRRRPREPRLTPPRTRAMIAMWRAGSRAR